MGVRSRARLSAVWGQRVRAYFHALTVASHNPGGLLRRPPGCSMFTVQPQKHHKASIYQALKRFFNGLNGK